MHSLNFHETFRFRWHKRYWNFSPILMFIIANSWSFQYLEYNQGPLQNTHWYFPVAWLISCLAAWGYYKFGLSLLKSICLEICGQHEEKMIWKKKIKKKYMYVIPQANWQFLSVIFWRMATLEIFSSNFRKAANFCDFLPAFLYPKPPWKWIYSERKEFALQELKQIYTDRWGKIIFDS